VIEHEIAKTERRGERFFVEHGSGAAIRRVDRRASRSARRHARSDHFFSTIADNSVMDLTEPLSQSDLATQLLLFRLTGT
jgi:hypothetical protein